MDEVFEMINHTIVRTLQNPSEPFRTGLLRVTVGKLVSSLVRVRFVSFEVFSKRYTQ
jgi:hypothetical protein